MKTQNNTTLALRKIMLGLAVVFTVGFGIYGGLSSLSMRSSQPTQIADGQETHGITPTTAPIQHNA